MPCLLLLHRPQLAAVQNCTASPVSPLLYILGVMSVRYWHSGSVRPTPYAK